MASSASAVGAVIRLKTQSITTGAGRSSRSARPGVEGPTEMPSCCPTSWATWRGAGTCGRST